MSIEQFAAQIGGEPRDLVADEITFLRALLPGRPWLAVWRHEDADGSPWLIVSLDIAKESAIERTFRLDFDGSSIVGGRSPASLNWDSGVRAASAGVDPSEEGVEAMGAPPALAAIAGDWFDQRRALGVSS